MFEENGDAPATKADVQALRSEVQADVQALQADVQAVKADVQAVKADIASLEERLLIAIHDAETRLLKAFYGWAQNTDNRLTATESQSAGVVSRLGNVETRLLEVEKRLNMPPGSAA
jgi:hypothetical protein